MSLQNAWHTRLAIGILLNDEKDEYAKLDLLTAIELESTNEETVKICEEFREDIANGGKEVAPRRKIFLSRADGDRVSERNSGHEEINEIHEGA